MKGSYCIKDNKTINGSFLLLSAERRCRETIELREGDKFYLSNMVEVEVLHIEHTDKKKEENDEPIEVKVNKSLTKKPESICEEGEIEEMMEKKKNRPHIRFNTIVETNEGDKQGIIIDNEYNDGNEYDIVAKLAVRKNKTYNDGKEVYLLLIFTIFLFSSLFFFPSFFPSSSFLIYLFINVNSEPIIVDVVHEVTLGSLNSNAVILPEPICGVHCKIYVMNDKLYLRDLAVGDIGGTKFFLSRPIELFERDVIICNELELGVIPITDCPVLECIWEKCAVRLAPIRKSKRTPIYSHDEQLSKTLIYPIPMEGETVIGRRCDNQVSYPDVYIYIYNYIIYLLFILFII